MNSKKVKEIKESLQQEIHLTEYVDRAYSENVRLDLLKDILTLINELESENERLKTQLAQANAGIVNCSGCKLVEINAVNEFAEKVKAKSYVNDYCREVVEIEKIDELLKEYEND